MGHIGARSTGSPTARGRPRGLSNRSEQSRPLLQTYIPSIALAPEHATGTRMGCGVSQRAQRTHPGARRSGMFGSSGFLGSPCNPRAIDDGSRYWSMRRQEVRRSSRYPNLHSIVNRVQPPSVIHDAAHDTSRTTDAAVALSSGGLLATYAEPRTISLDRGAFGCVMVVHGGSMFGGSPGAHHR